ncbi:MAG: TIGR00730 family Rossman fold protein [Calditrichaeota bacterium]|nr:MAG: TIGR00730 family Rossman fold protein [Calditrichota bacterium]
MQKICVFCGSSPGKGTQYKAAAIALGEKLAEQKIGLIYGGAKVGLMGEIAKTVLDRGGSVTGIIPRALVKKEVAFTDLPDLRIVNSMHERKALMSELSDGFIALPGGLGTIEELFEVLTWAQLGIHQKPCGILNVAGYFDAMIAFLDKLVHEKFMLEAHRQMIIVDDKADRLLEKFANYTYAEIDKAKWALDLKNS